MIEVHDLTKRFGGTVAVDHLTFQITPGIVTGFLGPNGSGKSTTMRMILGLDEPTEGTVAVNGRAYQDTAAPMHEVGALLEANATHNGLTARKHLRWLAQAGGIPTRRVDEVLELVGLSDVAGKKVGGFSLGMYQRLGIAGALLGDPEVLLLDEPVNGLDLEGIRWVRSLLRTLARDGRTVFVSSHLMSEMEETADHVLVIGRGRLIADASISDIVQHSSGNHLRIVSPDAGELAPVLTGAGATVSESDDGALKVSGIEAAQAGDLAAEHHLRLHELTPRRVSLEDAFMELTRGSVDYEAGELAETARALVHGGSR